MTVSLDETTTLADIDQLLAILAGGRDPGFSAESLAPSVDGGLGGFERASPFMTHPTFNSYHTGAPRACRPGHPPTAVQSALKVLPQRH